jgi:hypothetical protein
MGLLYSVILYLYNFRKCSMKTYKGLLTELLNKVRLDIHYLELKLKQAKSDIVRRILRLE